MVEEHKFCRRLVTAVTCCYPMATGSLPHSLFIHGTSATDGGQAFAGVNLGTINYARSNNNPSRVHWTPLSLLIIADTAI